MTDPTNNSGDKPSKPAIAACIIIFGVPFAILWIWFCSFLIHLLLLR